MSLNVPESTLTSDELRHLGHFRRELAEALDEAIAEGGDVSLSLVGRVSITDYGAIGNGVANDAPAIQDAVDDVGNPASTVYGYEIFAPPGTYLCTTQITNVQTGTKFCGRNAIFKFDSTSLGRLISLATNACDVTFGEGVTFFGAEGEDDHTTNLYEAVYMPGGNFDVKFWTCKFKHCRPNVVAQGLNPSGRTTFFGVDVFDAPLPASAPSNSTFALCNFINDELILTRSHMIYIFGYADNITVTGCRFKNNGNIAVKFDSASARYGQKSFGIITNNDFQGGGGPCIWLGSDSGDDVVQGFVVGGNSFRNTSICMYLFNAGVSYGGGMNVAVWDWESTHAPVSLSGAVVVSSGVGLGQLSPGGTVGIGQWTLQHKHPVVGSILFSGSVPAAGSTVTVGAVTYTWVSGAPTPSTNEIQLQGSPAGCCERLRAAVRGQLSGIAINPVLRGPADVFDTNDGSIGTIVIVSDATFALSTTGAGTTVTAAVVKAACFTAIDVRYCANVHVTDCIIDSFNYAFTGQCYKTVYNNCTLIDTGLGSEAGFQGDYRGCRFETHRPHSASGASHSAFQRARISDGWPIIGNNKGLIFSQNQEYTCPEMHGISGVVPISNGKAYIDLWYGAGAEGSTTSVNARRFKWTDGDTVRLTTPAAVAYTFTFKLVAPGANEFNSIATLRALIDGAGGGGVFVTSFVPTAQPSGLSYDLWIRITYDTVAANGNTCTLRVTTASWITGRILIDPDATPPDNTDAKFKGGNASVNSTKTVIWTQLADNGVVPHVYGMDATSHALAPWVDPADTVPGVCYLITHGAAGGAGAESFGWSLPS